MEAYNSSSNDTNYFWYNLTTDSFSKYCIHNLLTHNHTCNNAYSSILYFLPQLYASVTIMNYKSGHGLCFS